MVKSGKKDDFYRQMFKLDHSDHHPESAQCGSELIGCDYAELCRTVCNLGSITGGKFFEHSVYGILWTGHGSVPLLCAQYLWKEKHAGDPCRRGNCPSVFAMAISGTCGTGCIYPYRRGCYCLFTSDQELIAIGSSYHTDHGHHLSVLGQ